MPNVDVNVILYAVDLDELREWVGSGDEERLREARELLRADEDSDWEPEELEVLDRLAHRLVMEGKLYEGLEEEERYYLTQLLIDLFDEWVDADPLTEDLPLDRLLKSVESLPRDSAAGRMAAWLVRGRELNGDATLWQSGPVEESLSYWGYVKRDEVEELAKGLAAPRRGGARPPGRDGGKPDPFLQQLQSAAEECARAELDLVSFVG
ncbi:MAG: hypothetical protein ACK47B_26475 [Armatimonadota bacterium]